MYFSIHLYTLTALMLPQIVTHRKVVKQTQKAQ